MKTFFFPNYNRKISIRTVYRRLRHEDKFQIILNAVNIWKLLQIVTTPWLFVLIHLSEPKFSWSNSVSTDRPDHLMIVLSKYVYMYINSCPSHYKQCQCARGPCAFDPADKHVHFVCKQKQCAAHRPQYATAGSQPPTKHDNVNGGVRKTLHMSSVDEC